MDNRTIGVVVKKYYHSDILYYDNNFFIEVELEKDDDLTLTIKHKLNEILDDKSSEVHNISNTLPDLDITDKYGNSKSIKMYLVTISTDSNYSLFLSDSSILNNLSGSLYKGYFLKAFIRFDRCTTLVDSCMLTLFYAIFMCTILVTPLEGNLKILMNTLFDPFWLGYILYILLPMLIMYSFIKPRVINSLLKYDITPYTVKAFENIRTGTFFLFVITFLISLWSK